MKKRFIKAIAAAAVLVAVFFGGNSLAFARPSFYDAKDAAKKKTARAKTVRVKIDRNGFSPETITVAKGTLLMLIFTRADAKNCGSKVVFPALNLSYDLPVGEDVSVKITPEKSGEITFTCGMGMYRGTVVAR